MKLDTAAVTKLREILAEEANPDTRLRVFVQGGGCSGFQYGFALETEASDDDFDFDYEGVRVSVDAMSMQYLQGAEIRWVEDARGASFMIENPNAATTCGCGSSFSV
jgi:iron-sulfur cluster insertion protein